MDILPEFDKNAAYIWASYGIGLIVLGAMILRTAFAAWRIKRAHDQVTQQMPQQGTEP